MGNFVVLLFSFFSTFDSAMLVIYLNLMFLIVFFLYICKDKWQCCEIIYINGIKCYMDALYVIFLHSHKTHGLIVCTVWQV